MSVVHITGARPNFPKAAPVIAGLRDLGVEQKLVHTGQHYDDKLSEVFFRELDLPRPDINLGVGSGSHATQTAAVMVALEELFLRERPSLVVVYGDVNSTLAAALVCSKIGVPVAHVEAGLRSFDVTMPEEINRKVTDALSDLAFATSPDAIAHLSREGVAADRIHLVGNPMIDTLLAHLDRFDAETARGSHGLPATYAVATLHRPANVDDDAKARALVQAMHKCAGLMPILIPLHPRGRERLLQLGFTDHPGIRVVDPLGYVEFMSLVRGAAGRPHRLRRCPGGDHRARRTVPHAAPQHRTPGDHHARNQQAGEDRHPRRRAPGRRRTRPARGLAGTTPVGRTRR